MDLLNKLSHNFSKEPLERTVFTAVKLTYFLMNNLLNISYLVSFFLALSEKSSWFKKSTSLFLIIKPRPLRALRIWIFSC